MLCDKPASPHCKEALLIFQSSPSPPVVPASLALAQELSQAMLRMDMALEREYAFDIFSNLMVSTGSGGPHPTRPLATTWPGCQWHCASRILFAGEAGEGGRVGLLHSLQESN